MNCLPSYSSIILKNLLSTVFFIWGALTMMEAFSPLSRLRLSIRTEAAIHFLFQSDSNIDLYILAVVFISDFCSQKARKQLTLAIVDAKAE